MHQESTKNKSVTEWHGCGKCGLMGTNVECVRCLKFEGLQYLKLVGIVYGNTNADTQKR